MMRVRLALLTLALLTLAVGVAGINECSTFTESVDGETVICNGHGTCTAATKNCACYDGFGSTTDLAKKLQPPLPLPDCSELVCPLGKSWSDIPTSATQAHAEVECSDRGSCDRTLGTCTCFAGFAGAACDRQSCVVPNSDDDATDCSGHGQCLTLAQLATKADGQPLSSATSYGGYSTTTTWDEDMIRACLCDSSWTVGLAGTETQLPEYFGAFCELRRCPSGNDPMTTATDETDCENKIQDPTTAVITDDNVNGGASTNLCHVDCANRGICDFETGVCKCFTGYAGESCATQDALSFQ